MTHRSMLRFADARGAGAYEDVQAHLVITSPPYWRIKDYGVEGEVGYAEDYEAYIASLDQVWARCWAALLPGCRMCINVGDQFLRASEHGRYRVQPIRQRIIEGMLALGADYMGAIIWQKMTNTSSSGGGALMGSYPFPRNGILKIDYEFILLFKKPGKAPRPAPEDKEAARMTVAEWSRNFTSHWNFPGERQGKHHAMFPVELPRRLIRMFSFPGETVLDPFAGAGTTLLAALELRRRAVGIELNRGFEPAIRDRLGLFAAQVAFVGKGGAPRAADPAAPFLGAQTRVTDVGRERWAGTGKVDAVTGPTRLVVDGTEWRLEGLGAPPDPLACQTALQKWVGRRRVVIEPTSDGFAYLRLKNRTNVNAKLIKAGLVPADPGRKHRMRARFLRYSSELDL